MTTHHLTDQPFSALGLSDTLLRGLAEAGFQFCTPIQAEALPPALAGQDVAGQAQTGTGKTIAFLLATFDHLLRHPARPERTPRQPRAFMLAPTRELAIQIHRDAELIGRYTGFKFALVYGGTGYEEQRQTLEAGTDILIGTPGRIIDYHKQHVFDLKAVQVMVLDEADRMFDMGFIKDIRFLFHRMPPPTERLSLLFSATLSLRVTELAYEHMNNPLLVKIEAEKITVDRVREVIYHPANEEKIPLLIGLLKRMDPTRTLVFVNTKGAAERVRAWLEGNGFRVGTLSGDVPQQKRERLLAQFKNSELDILVATDVAARGLHIPNVSHVFNFDLPQDAEDYVHRIGRTARAGASGDAISFVCEEYAFSLMDIEEYIGHKIPTERVDPELLVKPQPPTRMERPERMDRGRRPPPSRGRPAPGGKRHAERHGGGAPRPPREESRPPREERKREDQPMAALPEAVVTPPAPVQRKRGPEKPAIG